MSLAFSSTFFPYRVQTAFLGRILCRRISCHVLLVRICGSRPRLGKGLSDNVDGWWREFLEVQLRHGGAVAKASHDIGAGLRQNGELRSKKHTKAMNLDSLVPS